MNSLRRLRRAPAGLRRAAAGFALTAIAFASCGPPGSDPTLEQMITAFQTAPEAVAHHGVRRVDATYVLDGQTERVSYTEEAWIAGDGRFHIVPKDVLELDGGLGAVGNVADFVSIQSAREGFIFRYRDFRVRDVAQIAGNYALSFVGQSTEFLGRAAWELAVSRTPLWQASTYVLVVDIETGLILKSTEYDKTGEIVSAMEYLSIDFDFDPDGAGIAWHQPENDETTIDLDLDPIQAASLLGFTPMLPSMLPEGYKLARTSVVYDEGGEPWLKAEYTDGVEVAFFLYGGPTAADVGTASTSPVHGLSTGSPIGQQLGGTGSVISWSEDPDPSQVLVYNAGAIRIVQGEVNAHEMIAVGKVQEFDLLRMLDTALPQ